MHGCCCCNAVCLLLLCCQTNERTRKCTDWPCNLPLGRIVLTVALNLRESLQRAKHFSLTRNLVVGSAAFFDGPATGTRDGAIKAGGGNGGVAEMSSVRGLSRLLTIGIHSSTSLSVREIVSNAAYYNKGSGRAFLLLLVVLLEVNEQLPLHRINFQNSRLVPHVLKVHGGHLCAWHWVHLLSGLGLFLHSRHGRR